MGCSISVYACFEKIEALVDLVEETTKPAGISFILELKLLL